jgi:outer membrane protein assembly factor BamB
VFVGGGPSNFARCQALRAWPGPINTWTEAAGHGAVIAVDPVTGERKWKFDMTDVTDSGILTTGSDLVFTGGREGFFQALDAKTGALLWKTNLAPRSPADRSHIDRQQAVRVRCCGVVDVCVCGG